MCGEIAGTTSTGYMDPAQYLPDFGENANWQYSNPGYNEQYLDQQRYVLKTGSQAVPGQQNLWVIHATAQHESIGEIDNPGSAIPPSEITVAGQASDANGNAYLALPNNSPPVDVTPMAPGNYTFSGPSAHTVSLYSMTVVSNSATQIDATDWAVVKTNAFVTIQATLSDPNAGSFLKWSGGGQAVPGNPLQWQVSAATSVETTVTASLASQNLSLNVWVLWSTITIQTSGNNPSPLSFTNIDLSDVLGVDYLTFSDSVCGKCAALQQ